MQTVKLLPDTPPPPPPPPPKDKAPEPQKQDKPQPQTPDNKPPEPDQQAALKSDEAAGDGPGSGLISGNVTKDYTDQKLGNQAQISGSGFDAAARLAATSFANTTMRSLNEFLARDRALKRSDYRVRVNLWLGPSGSLQRAELADSTGDPETDRALNEALQRFPGASTPLPQALQQPLRLQVTNRMLG
jgi:protein TonB